MENRWVEIEHEVNDLHANLRALAQEQSVLDWRELLWEVEHGVAGIENAKYALMAIQERILGYTRVASRVRNIHALRNLVLQANRLVDYQKQLRFAVPRADAPSVERGRILENFLRDAHDISYKLDEIEPFFSINSLEDDSKIVETIQWLEEALATAQEHNRRLQEHIAELQTKAGREALEIPFPSPGSPEIKVPPEIKGSMNLHRWVAGISGVSALLLVIGVAIWAVFTFAQFQPKAVWELIPGLLPKGIVLALAIVAGKICFASWHNYLILLHRQHVISSFEPLSKGLTSIEMRNLLLLNVYSTIASYQPTGFSKTPMESPALPSPARDILGSIDDSR